MRFLRLREALVALVTTALVTTTAATPAAAAPGSDLSTLASSSTFPLADPDTLLAKDGSYVTYGTTVGAGTGARCGATGRLYVPVLVHGSGSSVGMADCASHDALPSGPGAWAEPGGAVWAPGVARFGNRFFMFYTASRKGSGQKCIGRAISDSARGPFQNQGEWACPDAGRWALDANPFVAGGNLYVTYRDDAIASGAETGISTVRTDSEGRAIWDTRRDMLKSTDITWDTAKISGGTHVVENPAMWKAADGDWYLMYSGNNWDSARYSTGIARCGASSPARLPLHPHPRRRVPALLRLHRQRRTQPDPRPARQPPGPRRDGRLRRRRWHRARRVALVERLHPLPDDRRPDPPLHRLPRLVVGALADTTAHRKLRDGHVR